MTEKDSTYHTHCKVGGSVVVSGMTVGEPVVAGTTLDMAAVAGVVAW